jgi:mRNA-degrading endonuclease RelE of RelBE toxin-antitoxin system
MYKVLVSKTASKELGDLPTQVVNRIIPAIKKLGEDPRPPGSKKLKGESDS